MVLDSLLVSPTGTCENRPPFQRWEAMSGMLKAPGGAKEGFGDGMTLVQIEMYRFSPGFLSSLTGFVSTSPRSPPINRWAIFERPCGTCPSTSHFLPRLIRGRRQ